MYHKRKNCRERNSKITRKFPALKHRNYRIFLRGQSLSLIGTWMQRAAQQWLIYEMTDSVFIVGLVGVFQFTPMLFFSLIAGVLVDRISKKRVLIITQSIQMLQAFTLAVLVWSGHAKYWHILIMAAIFGFVHTFDMPTRQSFIIELVGKEDLVSAIGMNSSIVNLARIVGPAIAGIVLTYLGAKTCFLLNGFSFIAVLVGLINIKTYHSVVRAKEANIFSEIKDGLHYIFAKEILIEAILSMLIIGTIASNSDVIIPSFAKNVLGRGAAGYAILLSSMGIGSLIGSLAVASGRVDKIKEHILLKAGSGMSIFLILTGFTRNYHLTAICLVGVGLFSVIFMSSVNSTIQLNTIDKYRGRAMGVYTLAFTGTTPVGNFGTGLISDKLGANKSFIIEGVISLLLINLFFIYVHRIPKRHLQQN